MKFSSYFKVSLMSIMISPRVTSEVDLAKIQSSCRFSQQALGPWAGPLQVQACVVLSVTRRQETKQHFE